MRYVGFNTALLHGVKTKNPEGATHPPIYQSSAFRFEKAEDIEKVFCNKASGFAYTRINNPTVDAFEQRVTYLEKGLASVACASGMAAISAALLNILQKGDEIVAAAGLYGGTVELFDDLELLGIHTLYVEHNEPIEYEKLINDKTRLIFAETIGNPKLDVTDIKAVAEVAHKYNLPLVIDNTVSTPYLVQPIELGADIVINSSSKYINGNSDAISGVLTWSGKFKFDDKYPMMKQYKKFGSFGYIARLRNDIFRNLGGCLSPQNAFLNMIGMETLGLRMEHQCNNALELARFLEQLDCGINVNYPGLEKSKYHKLALKQFQNGFGAIVTFRCGSKERAYKIMNELNIPYILSNIGDTKTLIIHPASTIAVHLSKEEQEKTGVYEDLIRISVGIEDIEDLKTDFEQAIKKSI